MKTIRKSIITLLVLTVVALVGVAVYPAVRNEAFAESNHSWTYDEVNSLEELREVPVEQIAGWAQYDSRKYDIVTSVKNQGNTNLCWVYSSLAAMETNILRQGFSGKTKDEINLDEKEFAKASKGKWDDPLDLADTSGNKKNDNAVAWDREGSIPIVAQFASRWQGIYDESEIIGTEPQERYSQYKLRNAITCENNVTKIKKLIASYGGVAFTFHSSTVDSNYYYATGGKDHACFIVGWDDNIDKRLLKDSYLNNPAENGAWIVKNSYGSERFLDGYFYLSYSSQLYELTAFDMMPADEYDWCYNYSDKEYTTASYGECTPNDEANAEFAAVYQAKKGMYEKEYVKGVSVGVTGTNVKINVSVYTDVPQASATFGSTFDPKNGNPAAEVEYEVSGGGIYTIPLAKSVEVAHGSYFTVIIKVTNGRMVCDILSYRSDSYTYIYDSGKWNHYTNALLRELFCIKALTVNGEDDIEEIFDISNGKLELASDSLTYTGAEHRPEVTLTLYGETVLPNNYTVEYEDNINAGTATVKVEGKGNYIGNLQTMFTITKAVRSEFKVQLNDWTYGQTANTPSVINFGLEKGNITYSYGKSESGPFDTEYPEEAGTYYVLAEMDETDNYWKAVAISEFAIQKAVSPDFPEEFETLKVTGDMKVLSDIKLPKGWAWQAPEMQLTAGKMQVTVVYIGYDSANYEKTVFQMELDIPDPDNTENSDGGEDPPVIEPDAPDDGKQQPSVVAPDEGGDSPADDGDNTVAVYVGVTIGVVCAGAIGVVTFWFIRRRRKL